MAKSPKTMTSPANAGDFDDDASRFAVATINSSPAKDVCGHPKMIPGDHYHAKTMNEDTENGLTHGPPSSKIPVPPDAQEFGAQPTPWPRMPKNPSHQQTNASRPTIVNDRLLAHLQFEQIVRFAQI